MATTNNTAARLKKIYQISPDLCIFCGSCLVACPKSAIVRKDGKITILEDRCTGCGRCVGKCLGHAITLRKL